MGSLKCTGVCAENNSEEAEVACGGTKGEKDRSQRGRQETGWTVHYTPDKGQRDVLFMSQAVAAAASGAKVEMSSTRHRSPEPAVAQAASHRASGHASWLLLIMSKHTHTGVEGWWGQARVAHLSITLNRSVLIICC